MRFSFSQAGGVKDHILTSVFIFLSLILMVSRHDGGMQNIRKASITVFSYLEQPLANIRVYRTALQTNRELEQKNIIISDELSRLRSAREENIELKKLLGLVADSELDLLPVRIINKNLSGTHNFLTIDAGENDSLAVGMPLVNSDGLAGRIVLTSKNYSQVMPFLHPMFRVSARVQQSRAQGVVSWETENIHELVMNFVPQTIHVEVGSIVETSGYSREFPGNIPIGQVIRTESEPGVQTQRIYLRPFVSLHSIAEAAVIRHERSQEIDSLLIEYMELY